MSNFDCVENHKIVQANTKLNGNIYKMELLSEQAVKSNQRLRAELKSANSAVEHTKRRPVSAKLSTPVVKTAKITRPRSALNKHLRNAEPRDYSTAVQNAWDCGNSEFVPVVLGRHVKPAADSCLDALHKLTVTNAKHKEEQSPPEPEVLTRKNMVRFDLTSLDHHGPKEPKQSHAQREAIPECTVPRVPVKTLSFCLPTTEEDSSEPDGLSCTRLPNGLGAGAVATQLSCPINTCRSSLNESPHGSMPQPNMCDGLRKSYEQHDFQLQDLTCLDAATGQDVEKQIGDQELASSKVNVSAVTIEEMERQKCEMEAELQNILRQPTYKSLVKTLNDQPTATSSSATDSDSEMQKVVQYSNLAEQETKNILKNKPNRPALSSGSILHPSGNVSYSKTSVVADTEYTSAEAVGTPATSVLAVFANTAEKEMGPRQRPEKASFDVLASTNGKDGIPSLSVPLINKQRDLDEIMERIDMEVKVIEDNLTSDILASSAAIEKLAREANMTFFSVPNFGSVRQSKPAYSPCQPATEEIAFTQPYQEVNVIKEAARLGMRLTDHSEIFVPASSVNSKMKAYRPSTSRLNLTNVKTRIDSGVKRKSCLKPAAKNPKDTEQEALNIAGNASCEDHMPSHHRDNRIACLSAGPPDRKPPTNARKVIKTLQLDGDRLMEEVDIAELRERPLSASHKKPATTKRDTKDGISRPHSAVKLRSNGASRAQLPMRVGSAARSTIPSTAPASTAQHVPSLKTSIKPSTGSHDNPYNPDNPDSLITSIPDTPVCQTISESSSAQSFQVMSEQTIRHQKSNSEHEKRIHSDLISRKPSRPAFNCGTLREKHNEKEMGDDIMTAMDSWGHKVAATDQSQLTQQDSFGSNNLSQLPSADSITNRIQPTRSGPKRHSNVQKSEREKFAPHGKITTKPTVISTKRAPLRSVHGAEQPYGEVTAIEERLAASGLEVDRSTLIRALLPPTEQARSVCQGEITDNFHIAGLISSPKHWLPEQRKKVRLARRPT